MARQKFQHRSAKPRAKTNNSIACTSKKEKERKGEEGEEIIQ
jgi:hypothetical protein